MIKNYLDSPANMRKAAVLLFLWWAFLVAGCQPSRETIIKVPNRDVVFSITVDKVPEGQPIPHYISAILPDGTIAAKVLLYTGKKDQSKLFDAQDNGTTILVVAENGNRRTLWMVYTMSSAHFEDPRNLQIMTANARQAALTIRDPSVLSGP